jgi:hypothetical protein
MADKMPSPKKAENVEVKFLRVWSSDRGLFIPGDKASLPDAIASSLMDEGMVEVL